MHKGPGVSKRHSIDGVQGPGDFLALYEKGSRKEHRDLCSSVLDSGCARLVIFGAVGGSKPYNKSVQVWCACSGLKGLKPT